MWLTDPIVLKSNIKIHAEAGALVIFSTNKDLYPLIKSSYEGQHSVRCLSPIYGKDLENIAFTGEVYLNLGLLLTIGSCQIRICQIKGNQHRRIDLFRVQLAVINRTVRCYQMQKP